MVLNWTLEGRHISRNGESVTIKDIHGWLICEGISKLIWTDKSKNTSDIVARKQL